MVNLGLTRDYPEVANRYNLVDLVLHDHYVDLRRISRQRIQAKSD